MTSNKSLARLAGLLYLAVAVGGGFSQYERQSLATPGDGVAAAAAIAGHATLFRIAFVSDLLAITCFLAVGLLLYLTFLLWLLVRGAGVGPVPSVQGGLSWKA